MTATDIALLLTAIGLPTISIYWIRDRRRANIAANREERKTPYEVRATAATTLDAEVAALQKSFEMDRSVKERTITDLTQQLATSRAEVAARDIKIEELKATIETLRTKLHELQDRVEELQDNLEQVSRELEAMHSSPTLD